MIASGHPLATSAGLQVLREGGTAADAAVTAAAVCAVVLPHRTSIGGDVFAVVFDSRSGTVRAYNGSGAAPAATDVLAFRDGYPRQGAILATVPGAVQAWEDLLRDHGRLGLARALAPAISLAEDGFRVSAGLASASARWGSRLLADPEGAGLFFPGGVGLRAGELLHQPDLARSLRSIADGGAESFYRGALAERLVAGIASRGGRIAAEDLASHRTERVDALSARYRGATVFVPPPVSLGHVLLEELAILDGVDLSARSWGDAELVHVMVEAKKLAFADRDAHAGDPRVTGFDARTLLEPSRIAARRVRIGPRAGDSGQLPAAAATDTTYLAVVDRDRNAVSFIESIFHAFGAATIVPGTGVLLNNRLSGFSLDPASPNALAALKRPMHTLNPVLMLEGGRLRAVFGTPARDAQVQTNFQIAVALVDFGLDVQRAIESPRWRHDAGRTLQLERRFSEAVQRALARKGHEIALIDEWADVTGGVQAIRIEPDGTLAGGADPRREGTAAGY